MSGDRSKILNESPWPDNLNSQESNRSGIFASGSSRQEITGKRLPHGPEEVVTMRARAQSRRPGPDVRACLEGEALRGG